MMPLMSYTDMKPLSQRMVDLLESWDEDDLNPLVAGFRQGQYQATRETLLRLGTARFQVPSDSVQERIDAVADLKHLKWLVERVLSTGSWAELMGMDGQASASDKPTRTPLQSALQIAENAHRDKLDKRGEPKLFHPLRVLERVRHSGPDAILVALLHDVVEDSETSLDGLRQEGFSDSVVEAVDHLSRRKGEPYADYIVRCGANPLARLVKLADLEDNLQPSPTLLRPDRTEPDLARVWKYLLAYKYLTDILDEAPYRAAMKESRS
jgi:hypothetical protein